MLLPLPGIPHRMRMTGGLCPSAMFTMGSLAAVVSSGADLPAASDSAAVQMSDAASWAVIAVAAASWFADAVLAESVAVVTLLWGADAVLTGSIAVARLSGAAAAVSSEAEVTSEGRSRNQCGSKRHPTSDSPGNHQHQCFLSVATLVWTLAHYGKDIVPPA